METLEYEVAIIGGGLAGLVSAHLLAQKGLSVILFEKKNYPFHRVCGEYLSVEALDFLQRQELISPGRELPRQTSFVYSDTHGKSASIPLEMGGIGISRYVLDAGMAQKAKQSGAQIREGVQVEEVTFLTGEDKFLLKLDNGDTLHAKNVLGAYGKRSKLDKTMNRQFITRRSPYLGVKYHIRTDHDPSQVALHNFEGGYCGINAIEDGKFNLCYLGLSEQSKKYGSLAAMEQEVLWRNPRLKRLWEASDFLLERPEVISEISFEAKAPVENHMLMIGDAAGLITPLCGNGMAMAIRSGMIASELILHHLPRPDLEKAYYQAWNQEFAARLWIGRKSQIFFGSGKTSWAGRVLLEKFPLMARKIIQKTHGTPF